jgi:hypothetical protein
VFSSLVAGWQAVSAVYGGDVAHAASRGVTLQAVAVPASTAGCSAFGRGRITAVGGDRASLRGLVVASPARGVEFFRDDGPANAVRVVSSSVGAVTCSPGAARASVLGAAKVSGVGLIAYRIDVQLAAGKRGRDTYRIRLANGYDSGAQQIRHGNLNIHLRR